MDRKRKSENISPSDSQKPKKRAKSNMATPNTPVTTGTAGNGAHHTGMSPTQIGQGGINTGVQFSNQGGLSNQGYILPPVYQYPQPFMMNPGSPVLYNQYQNTPGVINNGILVNIQTSLERMHKKLGQLDTIQSSVQNITVKLVEMEQKMRDMKDSQNFISGKYDSLSTHTETNTNTIATLTSELKTLKTTNIKLKEDNAP